MVTWAVITDRKKADALILDQKAEIDAVIQPRPSFISKSTERSFRPTITSLPRSSTAWMRSRGSITRCSVKTITLACRVQKLLGFAEPRTIRFRGIQEDWQGGQGVLASSLVRSYPRAVRKDRSRGQVRTLRHHRSDYRTSQDRGGISPINGRKLSRSVVPEAVIHFKPDGTIVTANDNFLNTLGYRLEEIQGEAPSHVLR